ncbi:hypothetical protein cypCar_00017397 [Cyprinus carpio]|nr:hypothetical protein cypCar_00017397 [Cyprinus carpio]
MWNAFGNGSSGYVSKAQGWEFVPCSRLERPGKKLQSPASVRSFPSHLLELPPGPSAAPASDATGAQTPNQQPHTRIKKKLEELKKRFDQEKEEWRMEKEMLLRQVADIQVQTEACDLRAFDLTKQQCAMKCRHLFCYSALYLQGGENRRMLLDLKCVLEEVQSGVKREESKRGELQLQYTKHRCAWKLERSELKRRVSQLEARACSLVVETVRSPDRGDTLKRERAEQKKLLADTHSAAMDLRCRLENSEKGWVKEKSELLESFEAERKEWENQLMDMQQRIEEALKEIARVSEELCSYQDETRKWPDIKRSRSDSAFFPREVELVEKCPKEEGRRKETKDLVTNSSSLQQELSLKQDSEGIFKFSEISLKYLSRQQCKESSVAIKKSFSRPACPAKRRLPSRWASRSSVSSASTPSPPPTTTPPTVFTQRQTLTYSTFHTETVI